MSRKRDWQVLAGGVLLVVSAGVTAAQTQKPAKPQEIKPGSYEEQYEKYLKQARTLPQAPPPSAWGWMSGLAGDARARNVNDLVSINVQESITASGTADSSLSKVTSTSNVIGGLFGLTSKLPSAIDPTSLANSKSDNGFKGSGATTRTGVLTTALTARVAEVLPNGDLVVEGVREIDINGDNQVIVLTGVVRVADLSPGNVVSSTMVGQLRVQYFGRGLMKDSLNPGWLLRILNKVF